MEEDKKQPNQSNSTEPKKNGYTQNTKKTGGGKDKEQRRNNRLGE